MPLLLHLYPASPDPFRDQGVFFTYFVSVDSDVTIKVYTISGELVRTLDPYRALAGNNHELWDGRNWAGAPVASGVFIYRVEAVSDRDEHKSDFAKCAAVR